jgi:hypothetical protein
MGRLGVPKGKASDPNARPVFPAGEFTVTIDQVLAGEVIPWMTEIRYDDEGKAKVPFLRNEDAELYSIQFGSGVPVEDDQEDPGNMKLFLQLTTREGDVHLDEFDWDLHKGDVGYNMQRNVNVLVNLAHSMGYTIEEDGMVYMDDAFLQMLTAGELDGEQVNVIIKQTVSKKNGQTYANISGFAPVG